MSKAGDKLIDAAREAVAIAGGEQPAAAIWHNGHKYVPAAIVVTDAMVERACRVHNVGWSLWHEPQKKTARDVMRAALTAALAPEGD